MSWRYAHTTTTTETRTITWEDAMTQMEHDYIPIPYCPYYYFPESYLELYDHSSVRPSYLISSSHYEYPSTASYYSIDYPSTSSSSSYLQRHHPSSMDYSQQKTTGRQLQRLIYYSAVPCRLRSTDCAIYDVDCDEVFYGVYIGDAAAAKNKDYLRAMGITHVLNAAEGTKYGQVDTGHIYYRDMPKLRYMGFQVIDQITSDISRYFYLAAKFIENALNSGGKVLVHCLVGMSRSATCVIAYLMICRKMSAAEAIRKIRMRRSIRPNDGFLQQLADLDNELRADRERHHY